MSNNNTQQTTETASPASEMLKKHLNSIMLLLLVVALGGGGFYYYQKQQTAKHEEAQTELFRSVYAFEESAFEKALEGDETATGLLEVIASYPGTPAANLAHYYAGGSYMHLKKYDEAIAQLKHFVAKDMLIQARAWAVLGDALTEKETYDEAVAYYLKAADYRPNEFYTPTYLTKAAAVYETQKNYEEAQKCYQRIVDEFPKSNVKREAEKHIGRLATLFKQQP